MKKQKNDELKFLNSSYCSGISTVVMEDKRGKRYVGHAEIAEGDEYLANEIVGCSYAEARARVDYLKDQILIHKINCNYIFIRYVSWSCRLACLDFIFRYFMDKQYNKEQLIIKKLQKEKKQIMKWLYKDIANRPLIIAKLEKIKEERISCD